MEVREGGVWKGSDGGSEGGYGRVVLPLPTHMVGRLDGRREGEMDGGRHELGRGIDRRTPHVCKDERRWRRGKGGNLVREGGIASHGKGG